MADSDYAQPAYTYNAIEVKVKRINGRYFLIVRKFHTVTGVERIEQSRRSFTTEAEADQVGRRLANVMRERIEAAS